METAIKKAMDGGFERPRLMDGRWEDIHQTLLRPAFWQALGKAEGWQDKVLTRDDGDDEPYFYGYPWKTCWHRFIDHLALGKDVDSFFTELLTP